MSKMQNQKKLDITPELALAAYNTLIQFCRQQEASEDGTCNHCILYNNCPGTSDLLPEDWKEIHYPYISGNTTIISLENGKVQKTTYARSEDAKAAFEKMTNRKAGVR